MVASCVIHFPAAMHCREEANTRNGSSATYVGKGRLQPIL